MVHVVKTTYAFSTFSEGRSFAEQVRQRLPGASISLDASGETQVIVEGPDADSGRLAAFVQQYQRDHQDFGALNPSLVPAPPPAPPSTASLSTEAWMGGLPPSRPVAGVRLFQSAVVVTGASSRTDGSGQISEVVVQARLRNAGSMEVSIHAFPDGTVTLQGPEGEANARPVVSSEELLALRGAALDPRAGLVFVSQQTTRDAFVDFASRKDAVVQAAIPK